MSAETAAPERYEPFGWPQRHTSCRLAGESSVDLKFRRFDPPACYVSGMKFLANVCISGVSVPMSARLYRSSTISHVGNPRDCGVPIGCTIAPFRSLLSVSLGKQFCWLHLQRLRQLVERI